MSLTRRLMFAAATITLSAPLWSTPVLAQSAALKFGVGMFQPDREKMMPPTARWPSICRHAWAARWNCARSTVGRGWPRVWLTAKPTSP